MKILTIVGARPQFIKAAALSRELLNHPELEEVIVHTGQHFDSNMSDVFFEEMEIPKPKHNLGINSLKHGAMTGRMLEAIEELIDIEGPDILLVYGDTNSTIAGALAASKLHVAVGHVEAGLRSFNMKMPEEVNRILTDRISNVLFCPTDVAVQNLKKEGFDLFDCDIVNCGDVMQDAAYYYSKKSADNSTIIADSSLSDFVLVTLHRAENTDNTERLQGIVEALNELHQQIEVLLPLHPRTRKAMEKSSLKLEVNVIDPVGYFDMIELLKSCSIVMTDSGGLQKEAYFFKKNCVTMRDQTEWVELVNQGVNVLAGADNEKILRGAEQMLKKKSDFETVLYGGGMASRNIAEYLIDFTTNR